MVVTLTLLLLLVSSLPATAQDAGVATPIEPADVAASSSPPQRTITYEIRSRGEVSASLAAFANDVAAVLGDARGWTLGGSIAFRRVSSGGDLRVVLASPSSIAAAHPVCSANYSCRVGRDALINDRNWRNATTAWRATGAPLWQYRQYVVNHEIGHFLGFGHHTCPGSGKVAPVMQQQSISLNGCQPNGWPLAWERTQLGQRFGVPVYDDWIFPDVLRHNPHRDGIHALARQGIARGGTDGFYHPRDPVVRGQMAAFLTRALRLPTGGAVSYSDVPASSVHASSIAAIDRQGITTGYPDGTFRPWDPVTRGQMAAFLARGYGLTATGSPPFTDVPAGHVHAQAIAAVSQAGIAFGYADGRFRPNAPVSREEMASFLHRAMTRS